MKKIMLIALMLLGMTATVSANEHRGQLWTCEMHFNAKGGGLQLLVGHFALKGEGELSCISILGETELHDVSIKIESAPLALRVAIGKFQLHGTSANIALFTNDPQDLEGEYHMVDAQVAAGIGAGVYTAAQIGWPNNNLSISLQAAQGLGLAVGFSKMEIEIID